MGPRTADAIRQQIRDLGPWWLRDAAEVEDAIFQAFAKVFERIEAAEQTLFDRTFIGLADGSWLDQHGQEREISRLTGESDAGYRPRIQTIEDKVTIPAVVAGVNAVLLVGVATLEEHQQDGFYLTNAGSVSPSGFLDNGTLYEGSRCFTVTIQHQLVGTNDTAFLTESGSGAVESFMVETPGANGTFLDATDPARGDVYSDIFNEIDRLRAAGVTFNVRVEG